MNSQAHFYRVSPFNPSNRKDFFEFHTRSGDNCFCSAWWVDTWEGWLEQSPQENRALREDLLAKGDYDGYLLYHDERVIGWCQVGTRDRFAKLLSQFDLTIDPKTWAISCIRIDENFQRKGAATYLLGEILSSLSKKGIERVEAYPKLDSKLSAIHQWTGPKGLYEKAGFKLVKENESRAIYAIELPKIPIDQISRE